MIHRVSANKPQFHSVEFGPGFNMVLAERTKESTKKQTRNGLGKSTLIEIIHFCLGANCGTSEGLPVDALRGWVFTIEFDLGERRVAVSRATDHPRRVTISGAPVGWSLDGGQMPLGDEMELPVREWNGRLGMETFGLDMPAPLVAHYPSFRTLIAYFARRHRPGGYWSPFHHMRKQSSAQVQMANAFLLGLSAEHLAEWLELEDEKRVISELKRVGSGGIMERVVGSVGALRPELLRLQSQVAKEQEELSSFRVHERYHELVAEANELTEAIHALANANHADERLMQLYDKAVREEGEPVAAQLTALYEEAGIALPGLVVRRLEDVEDFHRQLVTNRREFLSVERTRLGDAVQERHRQIRQGSDRRASLLSTLQTHGALEEWERLTDLHRNTVLRLQEVEARIASIEEFGRRVADIRIRQEILQQEMRRDLDERRVQRDHAVRLFNENSEYLYQAPGNLIIDVGAKKGYQFDVTIERSGSHGINNMKIFCYDLMLAQVWADRSPSPGFLIHDSMLFLGVDERQKALALDLARRKSEAHGFQYICTMNSDELPLRELPEDFRVEEHVRLTLTDATPEGCLLGMRF